MSQKSKYLLFITTIIPFICFSSLLIAQDISEINSQRKQANSLFESGKKMMDKGLFEKAEILLSDAIDLHPTDTEFWVFRATCRERLGKQDAAIRDYNQILKNEPNRFDALFSRSVLFYETGRYPLAIEGFDQLIAMPKGETKAVYFKGTSFNPSGETDMSGIVSLNSEHAELFHYRGLAKWQLNYRNGALEDFKKAIEADNQQPDYYVNRGLIYLEKKDTLTAIRDMQKALELDPENSLALYNLSLAGSNHESAIEALNQVVSFDDGFPSAYANRAYARLENGNYLAAIADYDTAIMLDHTQAEFYSNRGIAHKKARQLNKAISDFSKAISIDIAWAKNYALRGEVYFKTGKFKDAVDDFSGAIAYEPNNGNYYYNRALAYRRIGESENCCKDLQIALRLGITQANRAMAAYCKE